MWGSIATIIQDLLIFVGALVLLLVVLVAIVVRLPSGHPLKQLLWHLCFRVGATLGAGLLAIPVEPIPGVDIAYDVGAPLVLAIYWFTFFREVYRRFRPAPAPARRR